MNMYLYPICLILFNIYIYQPLESRPLMNLESQPSIFGGEQLTFWEARYIHPSFIRTLYVIIDLYNIIACNSCVFYIQLYTYPFPSLLFKKWFSKNQPKKCKWSASEPSEVCRHHLLPLQSSPGTAKSSREKLFFVATGQVETKNFQPFSGRWDSGQATSQEGKQITHNRRPVGKTPLPWTDLATIRGGLYKLHALVRQLLVHLAWGVFVQ